MAMRRSFGAGGMKASKPVSFSSGGGNSLMNMMMAQSMLPQKEAIKNAGDLDKEQAQRDIQVNKALNRPGTGDAVVTEVNDPSGFKMKTQGGQDYDVKQYVRQKAAEDTRKLTGMYDYVKQLSDLYDKSYDHAAKTSKGLEGKFQSIRTLGEHVLTQKNIPLQQYLDFSRATGAQMAKFGGDVGNISVVEQQNALGRLPVADLNSDYHKWFTPQSYEAGRQILDDTMDLYKSRLIESQYVTETGDVNRTHYESNPDFVKQMATGGQSTSTQGVGSPAVQSPTSPNTPPVKDIAQHRIWAQQAIQSGKVDAKKVAVMFKQETGEDL